MEENDIDYYQFPTSDISIADKNEAINVFFLLFFSYLIKSKFPFATVSSNAIEIIDGKEVRVRKLPWGMVKGNLF